MRRAAASLLARAATSTVSLTTAASPAGRSLGAVAGLALRSYASDAALKKTPLYDMHVAAGGALPFLCVHFWRREGGGRQAGRAEGWWCGARAWGWVGGGGNGQSARFFSTFAHGSLQRRC